MTDSGSDETEGIQSPVDLEVADRECRNCNVQRVKFHRANIAGVYAPSFGS